MWDRIKDWFTARWTWVKANRVVTGIIVILALFAADHLVLHGRINRRTRSAWEASQTLFKDALPRIKNLEEAMKAPESGILAQLDQIHTKNHQQDQRLDKVETRVTAVETKVGDLGTKLDRSTALLLDAIKGLGGKVDESSPDEGDAEEPTAEPVAAEPEESVARAVETPRTPAKAAKPATKARTKPVKSPTARARAAEPAKTSAARRPSEPAEAAPVARALSAPAARSGPENPDAFLNAAERIHADAETLLEGALEGRKTTPVQDARIAEHKRRYQPVAIRPTAWREVRTDETCVVHVGR